VQCLCFDAVCVDTAFSIIIFIIIQKNIVGVTSNKNAVTLLCIFNHNYNHNNSKKVNKQVLGIFK